MRNEIVHIGAGELNYEIRNIMKVVEKVNALGVNVNLENIGDPVAKGEKIPSCGSFLSWELGISRMGRLQ